MLSRRHLCLVILLALVWGGLRALWPTPTHLARPLPIKAEIEELTGEVDVWELASAIWVPAQVGQVVTDGARVLTGPEGRVVLYLSDGSILRLPPNSMFRLGAPVDDPSDTPIGVASVRG